MRQEAKRIAKKCTKLPLRSSLPKNIKNIFTKDYKYKSLDQDTLRILLSYYNPLFKKKESIPNVQERLYLLNFLYQKKHYNNVINLCHYYILSSSGKNQNGNSEDLWFTELKYYLGALAKKNHWVVLDGKINFIIKRYSKSKPEAVEKLILSTLGKIFSSNDLSVRDALFRWCQWTTAFYGHCKFTKPNRHSKITKGLIYYINKIHMREKSSGPIICNALDWIKSTKSITLSNQLSTTLISILTQLELYKLAELVWNYKLNNQLNVVASDLTCILRIYRRLEKYSLVVTTYEQHPEIHTENQQFDYVLIAKAQLKDWSGLRAQFDALFGIGELPSLRHYGTVMYAIATEGDIESVDKLYVQLLHRGFKPDYAILQALLFAHYSVGDMNGCLSQYELFRKYSVKPSPSTIAIMLKVHMKISGIDGALKFLKRILDSDPDLIDEKHFSSLINMCSTTTNYLIAEELFHVMKDDYNLIPTSSSIASLMQVYIESKLYEKAQLLYSQYINSTEVGINRLRIYNKGLLLQIAMKSEIGYQAILNRIKSDHLKLNEESYFAILSYHIKLKKDYIVAEQLLMKLLENPMLQITSRHFNLLFKAYDYISNREGVFRLYKTMTSNGILLNSSILFYIIKSTFKIQLRSQKQLDQSIALVQHILGHASRGTLDIPIPFLHPSIVAWPMRMIARYDNPEKAFQLLNQYNKLFYKHDDYSANNKFVIMRSQLVIYATLEQWDTFGNLFDVYWQTILNYSSRPSATVPNLKANTLMKDLFYYKVRHLAATNSISELPKWLETLEEHGLVLDNTSWNEAVRYLFSNPNTISVGLKYVNSKLIHGFNIIHKLRLAKKHQNESGSGQITNWLLSKRQENPKSYVPTLYIKSDVYHELMELLDKYLNYVPDLESKVKNFAEQYPYFMKSYLLSKRTNVAHWEVIETKYKEQLQFIRSTKRILSKESW
ncbi:hypothetical protein TBLA_0C00420 [Henningerozyma blattae CBS 6284]|uniref:Pentacotripeptide-repeat region of PRORP domain-containing protein n=1 Tax=Henningerozyma blattae (strain ATCC 34711 / CBS 6284 / DSM 70876 / NBRC 10599 / NRRL Y-10934 / UCD 77-7) TaxID=1071380 RepID=I2H0F6_HENB6|nr:hypothetical protein TBLA_0C00420 [Tetrapisispora blattae CBS 6284]CCH59858.1 hypothetical protein TBLA_0C00420 [Tetrapisispora blattae CBS 6284]